MHVRARTQHDMRHVADDLRANVVACLVLRHVRIRPDQIELDATLAPPSKPVLTHTQAQAQAQAIIGGNSALPISTCVSTLR